MIETLLLTLNRKSLASYEDGPTFFTGYPHGHWSTGNNSLTIVTVILVWIGLSYTEMLFCAVVLCYTANFSIDLISSKYRASTELIKAAYGVLKALYK